MPRRTERGGGAQGVYVTGAGDRGSLGHKGRRGRQGVARVATAPSSFVPSHSTTVRARGLMHTLDHVGASGTARRACTRCLGGPDMQRTEAQRGGWGARALDRGDRAHRRSGASALTHGPRGPRGPPIASVQRMGGSGAVASSERTRDRPSPPRPNAQPTPPSLLVALTFARSMR